MGIVLGDIDLDGDLDLVCGNFGVVNTLYLNNGGLFEISPEWSTDSAENTLSVTLGDVDGDGDLDLVCGNTNQGNSLYLNEDGMFDTAVAWSSGPSDVTVTSSVTLGDVDNDGDLDLICGNFVQPNTIYWNEDGMLSAIPDTISSAPDSTMSVALGDIDNDNDLDLVCGNYGANTLFLNDGGVFETIPSWTSIPANHTKGISLGDINGDGDLDLVCSNVDNEANTVYINQGVQFETIPSWSSGPANATTTAALGDVDNDGDLDLICGNELQSNTLYLNEGPPGLFATNPIWFSGPANKTISIAAGDLDGDGDLDLVCGNTQASNTAYLNGIGPFGVTSDWSSGPANRTLSVSVGDINRDGYLDFVCGNYGANVLYFNEDGQFAQIPTWFSVPVNQTAALALGDIDGDGDLDLACGNSENPGQVNTVYLNQDGLFATTPAWSSIPANITVGICLGDVDGDDDLDLVCGNAGQANTVYLNNEGMFEVNPVWSSLPTNPTSSIALGDIDNDGDLDLACGNSGQSGDTNTVYVNEGGMFVVDPIWHSGRTNMTGSIALGDVDGDGDLDLVCGNDGQPNAVYLNEGGMFTTGPVWTSGPSYNTTGVALWDIDGDGDLDLVCSNRDQANTVYKNENGMFVTIPVWLSESTKQTEDVSIADIDNDGDLDLVFGNQQDVNSVYLGDKNPTYHGNPSNPTHHIPNNGAFISSVGLKEAGTNMLQLFFYVVDVESDPAWVLAEYQFEGDPDWFPAQIDDYIGLTGPFDSSPAGQLDSLTWDITKISFDTRNVVLRFNVIEIPVHVSFIQHASSYSKRIGPILPQRPEIATSTHFLEFETVTVGDSTSLDLVISNAGTVDLVVDQLLLPSTEMRVDVTGAFVVPPQASVAIRVFLEPERETDISGYIELLSNDPIRPVDSILVSTDIRALEVTSRLLTSTRVIPLGEAATVLVEPLPDVNVERGFLFHRPSGRLDFDPIPLGRSGDDFVAVIPGSSVTEVGLEYYVLVENTPIQNTDPPNAPDDSVYFWPVEQPKIITSSPRPTLNDDFIEGRSIKVQVFLPQGAGFRRGKLYFRESAKQSFGQTDLLLDGSFPSALILDSVVGPRGVEYWVQVETLTDTLTDPPVNPIANPASIPILVTDLVEPNVRAAKKYRLLSIPLKMRGSILGSIADELGGKDNTIWRLFLYDAVGHKYVELPNDTINSFKQGQSYWLITLDRHRIGTGPDRGETALTDRLFEIVLQSGYNLVGNPYNFPVAWDSLWVDTLSMADALGLLVEAPIGWVQGQGLRYDVDVLQPFDGYWVKNLTMSPVVLKVPAVEALPAPSAQTQIVRPAKTHSDDLANWSVCILVSSAGVYDATGLVGMHPKASNEWDPFDRSKPPLAPGKTVSLYFPHTSWKTHRDYYAHDIRGKYMLLDVINLETNSPQEDAWGQVWFFDVAKNFTNETAGDEVVLEFKGIESLPEEAAIYLIDEKLGGLVDLRITHIYRFYQGRKDLTAKDQNTRFVLIVGNEEFITNSRRLPSLPTRTRLHQNYPNPFNPSTVVRYEISKASYVTLRVFDANGVRIRELYHGYRKPGVYEIAWDARNDDGQTVASGIYFCRLKAGTTIETRKMLFLK